MQGNWSTGRMLAYGARRRFNDAQARKSAEFEARLAADLPSIKTDTDSLDNTSEISRVARYEFPTFDDQDIFSSDRDKFLKTTTSSTAEPVRSFYDAGLSYFESIEKEMKASEDIRDFTAEEIYRFSQGHYGLLKDRIDFDGYYDEKAVEKRLRAFCEKYPSVDLKDLEQIRNYQFLTAARLKLKHMMLKFSEWLRANEEFTEARYVAQTIADIYSGYFITVCANQRRIAESCNREIFALYHEQELDFIWQEIERDAEILDDPYLLVARINTLQSYHAIDEARLDQLYQKIKANIASSAADQKSADKLIRVLDEARADKYHPFNPSLGVGFISRHKVQLAPKEPTAWERFKREPIGFIMERSVTGLVVGTIKAFGAVKSAVNWIKNALFSSKSKSKPEAKSSIKSVREKARPATVRPVNEAESPAKIASAQPQVIAKDKDGSSLRSSFAESASQSSIITPNQRPSSAHARVSSDTTISLSESFSSLERSNSDLSMISMDEASVNSSERDIAELDSDHKSARSSSFVFFGSDVKLDQNAAAVLSYTVDSSFV